MPLIITNDRQHALIPERIEYFKFLATVEGRTALSAVVNGVSILIGEFDTFQDAEAAATAVVARECN